MCWRSLAHISPALTCGGRDRPDTKAFQIDNPGAATSGWGAIGQNAGRAETPYGAILRRARLWHSSGAVRMHERSGGLEKIPQPRDFNDMFRRQNRGN